MRRFRFLIAFLVVLAAAGGLLASGALARGYTGEEQAVIDARWSALVATATESAKSPESEHELNEILERWSPVWQHDRGVLLALGLWQPGKPVGWGDESAFGSEQRAILHEFLEWLDRGRGNEDSVAIRHGLASGFRALCVTTMTVSEERPRVVVDVGILCKRVRSGSTTLASCLSYGVSRQALARAVALGCDEGELRKMRPDSSELPLILAHDALSRDTIWEQVWAEDEFWRLAWRDAHVRRLEDAVSGRTSFATLAEEPRLEWLSRRRRWVIDKLQDPEGAAVQTDTVLSGGDQFVAQAYLVAAADFDAVLD